MKKRIARYLAYNKSRISRATAFNPTKANLLFRIIPFLLHSNFKDLPGYVEKDCPFGIHHFQPKKAVDPRLFQRYFSHSTARHVQAPEPHTDKPCIHSLKTIGSIGTIAQTEISDCDYWLSIRQEEIGSRGVELLERKCRDIEEWAAKRGTEVHFFLMDIDQTRDNSFQSNAEEESAGSAIKALLKDELFRTHILVAGKMLLWWLIPPGLTEDEYRKYVLCLHESDRVSSNYFIDLGYLSDIPKAEIFGACLWQMNKALDSPFKSVIKFAYLELLLQDTAETLPLFSDKIKCLVTFPEKLSTHKNEELLKVAAIDPYLLLAKEIAAFYSRDPSLRQWDNFIRECLYLKTIGGMQSQKKGGTEDERLLTVLKLMENWDLLPDDYERFTEFHTWKYKQLLEFGTKVHDYLIETYKRLRWIFKTFTKENAVTITQRDLSVLGRKLFTFYEKKPGKIEYICNISRQAMAQRDVTFHITRSEGIDHYYAFQGAHETTDIKHHTKAVIKGENDAVSLIAWLVINGIIDEETRLHLTKNFPPIDLVDLQQLAQAMFKTFPKVHFAHIAPALLLQKEEIIRALVVVNMNKAPVKGSKNLESTVITTNSYGEYFIHHHQTMIQLKNMLRLLLTKHFISRWNNNLETFIPHQPEQHHIEALLNQ